MASETMGEYEIEYEGLPLTDVEGWAAWLTIYGPSSNPMHRNSVFPTQRVSVETVFPSQEAAEAEARKVGLAMLNRRANVSS